MEYFCRWTIHDWKFVNLRKACERKHATDSIGCRIEDQSSCVGSGSLARFPGQNRFYPLGGSYFDFAANFFAENLGSKYSFQSYNVTFSKYVSVGGKQVLAYNAFACATGGEPPFYGNCIYGTDNQLRGYTAGRYLDRYMMTTQLEYRLVLPWRFGLVGFGGLGGVIPGEDQLRTKQFLPAGGTGIRFMLSDKYHVNLRTDFAWGKDNFTWSMAMGEAF